MDNSVRTYRRKNRIKRNSYSGNLIIRIPPELHQRVSELAFENKVSINLFIIEALEKACAKEVNKC